MINSADKYTIADIFMVDSQVKYVIPKFQREYIWNKDNWDDLLSDITEDDSAHFVGSIICINPGTDTLRPELEIIDGQQRLTTVSLLLCAIYKLLKSQDIESDDDLKLIKWKLIQRRGENSIRLELSRQNNNFKDYQSILDEAGIKEFGDHASNKGNRRIYKCYRYFLNRLEEYNTEDLLNLLAKVDRILLVKIEVNSHSDAFMLFESLNNRGIPLSAIDLIKNKMLAELEKKEIMPVEEAFTRWNKIINNLPDYVIQERFLRQH
ncbi:DUF262 domain-containing protein, partial [Candidatus Parcubacteria bacterium]|nr:DUF262 domain-containing protein [Candidatus Parcubacteria bacterium]